MNSSVQTFLDGFSQASFKSLTFYRDELRLSSPADLIETISQAIVTSLDVQRGEPEQMLMALRFLKDCTETLNPKFIAMVDNKLLTKLSELASFRKGQSDDQRGQQLFSNNPNELQKKFGVSIIRMVCDEVRVWAHWFENYPLIGGKSLRFKQTYDQLIHEGLVFPQFTYYKQQTIDEIKQRIETLSKQVPVQTPQQTPQMPNQEVQLENCNKLMQQLPQILQPASSSQQVVGRLNNFLKDLGNVMKDMERVVEEVNDNDVQYDLLEKLLNRLEEAYQMHEHISQFNFNAITYEQLRGLYIESQHDLHFNETPSGPPDSQSQPPNKPYSSEIRQSQFHESKLLPKQEHLQSGFSFDKPRIQTVSKETQTIQDRQDHEKFLAQLASLQREHQNLQKAHQQTIQEKGQLLQDKQNHKESLSQLASLQRDHQHLQTAYQQATQEKGQSVHDRQDHEKLVAQITSLQRDHQNLQKAHQQTTQEKVQLLQVREDHEKTLAQLTSLQRDHQNLQKAHQQITQEKEQMHNIHSTAIANIQDKHNQQYQRLQQDHQQLQQKLSQVQQQHQTQAPLERDDAERQRKVDDYDNLLQNHLRLQQSHEDLQRVHQNRVMDFEQDQQTHLKKIETVKEIHGREQLKLAQDNAELQNKHAKIQHQHQMLQTTHESLQSQYANMREENAQLQQAYESIQNKHSNLQSDYKLLQENQVKSNIGHSQVQVNQQLLQHLQNQLDTCLQENNSLRQQIKQLNVQNSNYLYQLDQLRKDHNEVRQAHQSVLTDHNELQAKHQQLLNNHVQLKNEINQQGQNQNQETEMQLRMLEDRLAQMTEQRDTIHLELSQEMQAMKNHYEAAINQIKLDKINQSNEIKSLQTEILQLQMQSKKKIFDKEQRQQFFDTSQQNILQRSGFQSQYDFHHQANDDLLQILRHTQLISQIEYLNFPVTHKEVMKINRNLGSLIYPNSPSEYYSKHQKAYEKYKGIHLELDYTIQYMELLFKQAAISNISPIYSDDCLDAIISFYMEENPEYKLIIRPKVQLKVQDLKFVSHSVKFKTTNYQLGRTYDPNNPLFVSILIIEFQRAQFLGSIMQVEAGNHQYSINFNIPHFSFKELEYQTITSPDFEHRWKSSTQQQFKGNMVDTYLDAYSLMKLAITIKSRFNPSIISYASSEQLQAYECGIGDIKLAASCIWKKYNLPILIRFVFKPTRQMFIQIKTFDTQLSPQDQVRLIGTLLTDFNQVITK